MTNQMTVYGERVQGPLRPAAWHSPINTYCNVAVSGPRRPAWVSPEAARKARLAAYAARMLDSES